MTLQVYWCVHTCWRLRKPFCVGAPPQMADVLAARLPPPGFIAPGESTTLSLELVPKVCKTPGASMPAQQTASWAGRTHSGMFHLQPCSLRYDLCRQHRKRTCAGVRRWRWI